MSDDQNNERRAEEAFDRFVEGETDDFKSFVAQFPDIEKPLRELYAAWVDVGQHLGSPPKEDSGDSTPDTSWIVPPEKYEILEEIGRGGMGVVYKAKQKTPDRIVAIKAIQGGILASEEQRQRFLREADAAVRVKHAGIVSIHDVDEYRGNCYFTMDFVEGETLDRHIETCELDLRGKLELFQRICVIIGHAHIHGVIHRDLKPSNIMIDSEGKPRILDFGLAKITEAASGDSQSRLTRSGVAMGTLAYMSPEQTLGKPDGVDTRADVYSLGVILYEMLTGEMPYPVDSSDSAEIIANIRERDPQMPGGIRRELRDEPETIVLKALAKEKERRYQSVAAFAEDIERYLKDEPIAAKPPSTAYRVRKLLKRHKLAATIAGILLLGIIVAFAFVDSARREAEGQRRHAAQEAYCAKIGLAEFKARERNIDQTEKLLASCPEELRNWEWGWLKRLCHLDLMTLRGHTDGVRAVDSSPDGKRIISGGLDGIVRIWDAESGKQERAFTGHTKPIYDVAFSPDGKHVASVGGDSTLRIWDVATGQAAMAFRGRSKSILYVAFSPDGRRIAGANHQGVVQVWDLGTRTERLAFKASSLYMTDIVFSPDSARLATSSLDGTVRIWDAATGKQLIALKGQRPNCVVFSPDGWWVAAGSRNATVRIWDLETKREIKKFVNHLDAVKCLCFSPDGARIASAGGDKSIVISDIGTGRQLLRLQGHSDVIWSIAYSPDGSRIVSGSADGTLKVWDAVNDRQALRLAEQEKPVLCLAFSPDGGQVFSGGSDGAMRAWDVRTGQELRVFRDRPGDIVSVAVSPDGKRIVSATAGHDAVQVWDVNGGKPTTLIEGSGMPCSVTSFPNGRRIASGFAEGMIRIYDMRDGEEGLSFRASEGMITGIAIGPGGKRIASGGGDGTVRLWDAETGEPLNTIETADIPWVKTVSFSPDGRQLLIGGGAMTKEGHGGLLLWDIADDRIAREFEGHRGMVNCAGFSPDGERVVSAGSDRAIKVWDRTSGHELVTLWGHAANINAVAFSPDGRLIASASNDRTIVLWKATDWE